MEIFATVVTGVTVFVLGQIIVRFFIDPVVAFKLELGEIQHVLIKHQHHVLSMEDRDGLSDSIGQHCSRLIAMQRSIPCYGLFAKLRILPLASEMLEGHRCLYRLYHYLRHSRGGVDEGHDFLDRLSSIFDVPYVAALDPGEYL